MEVVNVLGTIIISTGTAVFLVTNVEVGAYLFQMPNAVKLVDSVLLNAVVNSANYSLRI